MVANAAYVQTKVNVIGLLEVWTTPADHKQGYDFILQGNLPRFWLKPLAVTGISYLDHPRSNQL